MKKNRKLKMALFDRGITQSQLSRTTGIPKAYISQAIHGRYILDPEQLRKIAGALGMDEAGLV